MGDSEIFNRFGGHSGFNHPGADADEINNNTSVEQVRTSVIFQKVPPYYPKNFFSFMLRQK